MTAASNDDSAAPPNAGLSSPQSHPISFAGTARSSEPAPLGAPFVERSLLSDDDLFAGGVARVWRLHHVVFLSTMAALSDPARLLDARIIQLHPDSELGFARIGVVALQALTPLVLLALCVAAARRDSPFRRWYEHSRRWWCVPAGLFAVAAIPRWMASRIEPSEALSFLVPVAEAALGIGSLWGLVPRGEAGFGAHGSGTVSARESDGARLWRDGLLRFWLPTVAVGLGIWRIELGSLVSGSTPGLVRAGLVDPRSVIALAYIVWMGGELGLAIDESDRATFLRRVGLSAALLISALLLCPWPDLWTDYIYRSSAFTRLTGWAFGVPALLEIARDAELTYGLLPCASFVEFLAAANQSGSAAAREFLRSAAAGGFTVAALAPFLLMVALAFAIRRRRWRWPLLLLALPVVFACCLCDTTLVSRPPWPWYEGPSPVLYPWNEFLAKASWMTLALGALVAWMPTRPAPAMSRGDGRATRGAWRWIAVYVLFSSAVSLFLAAALTLGARRNSEAAEVLRTNPSSWALLNLLDSKFAYSALSSDDVNDFQNEVLLTSSMTDESLDRFAALWAEYIVALPEVARFESRGDLVTMRVDYADIYSIDYILLLRSSLAAKALGGFAALDRYAPTRNTRWGEVSPAIGTPPAPLRFEGMLLGIEATSTTLHALEATDRVATSGNWHRERAREDIFRVCDGMIGYLESTTDTLLRKRSVERLLDATRLSDSSQFLCTGRADILWRMVQSGDMVRFWPGRVVADYESGSFANLNWLYSSSSRSLFRYHWMRARLRCLLFRERVGRFPGSWSELQSKLGWEPMDGILEILDAPFSAYLTFTVAPDDSLTLEWGLPPGHPMAVHLPISGVSPAIIRMLGPLFVPPPLKTTPPSAVPVPGAIPADSAPLSAGGEN